MGDAAEKQQPGLPPPPAQEGFKRTRDALGVGAYTSHLGLPPVLSKVARKLKNMRLRNTDNELTPAKKRERILVISAVVLGLLYFYNEYSKSSSVTVGSDMPSMEVLMQDDGFKRLVEIVKKEQNQTDLTPEVYREALSRFRTK